MSFNMYSCLASAPCTTVCQRNYTKKLREISKLKQKKQISSEELEKIKKESEYKKLVGAYVAPPFTERNNIMNKLPDDVLFIILSYIPKNVRLMCFKPLHNKMFVNNFAIIQIHEKKMLQNVHILRKIAVLADKVKRIYSPDDDGQIIRINIKDDLSKRCAQEYYYFYTRRYYDLINDVCKNYTAIYTGTKKYSNKEIDVCEKNVFKIYLKMAVLLK